VFQTMIGKFQNAPRSVSRPLGGFNSHSRRIIRWTRPTEITNASSSNVRTELKSGDSHYLQIPN
jgi:hypothetical protein